MSSSDTKIPFDFMVVITDPNVVLECDEEVLGAMVQWMTGTYVEPSYGVLPSDKFIFDPSKAVYNT